MVLARVHGVSRVNFDETAKLWLTSVIRCQGGVKRRFLQGDGSIPWN